MKMKQKNEIVYRKLNNGAEITYERVLALRTHRLKIESHLRNRENGITVQWGMPEAESLSAADAFVQEAMRLDRANGIPPDPVRDAS